MAKILIIVGIIIVVVGVVLLLFPQAFSWFGRLPGDVHLSKGNTQIYFPIVTMIIISIVASIVLNLFNK